MAAATVVPLRVVRKLVSFVPDTDFSRLVAEAFSLAECEPRILEMIDRDRDAHAIQKKKERLEDHSWLMGHGARLAGFDVTEDKGWADNLDLSAGRPRMPAILVFIFILIRGYLGGFKDRKTASMLSESKTLEIVLANLGQVLPGASTILDNINSVKVETLEFILDTQIGQARREALDDFRQITVDSTGVEANSTWPTDSGTIAGLAARAKHLLRELVEFGVLVKLPAIVEKLVADIEILHKQIQLSSGKKDSAQKRKKFYRKLFKLARQVRQKLLVALQQANKKAVKLTLMPSLKARLLTRLEWIDVDLINLALAIDNGVSRVLRDQKVPTAQKVVSLSDESAAIIAKGGREPLLGYKPQIARSENGFVTAVVVPEGNAADSGQLRSIVDASLKRTGILPSVLSFDDGYTNGDDRTYYLGRGVAIVSFSGSKGKRLIPVSEYDSPEYKQARNNRSAVESLMFTLKHNYEFDRMMRRGIDNVRSEMLEKSVVHNFFRLIKLRQEFEAKKAAA